MNPLKTPSELPYVKHALFSWEELEGQILAECDANGGLLRDGRLTVKNRCPDEHFVLWWYCQGWRVTDSEFGPEPDPHSTPLDQAIVDKIEAVSVDSPLLV